MDLTPEQQEYFDAMLTKQREEINAENEEKTAGLKSNNAALLAEKKAAQAKSAEAEEQKRLAEESKLKDAGDHKKLFEAERLKNQELEGTLKQRDKLDEDRTINSFASKMAIKLTGGMKDPTAVDLATGILSKNVTLNDQRQAVWALDGIQTDQELIESNFIENYSYLVAGSGSTGGGAGPSASGGSGTAKPGTEEARKKRVNERFGKT